MRTPFHLSSAATVLVWLCLTFDSLAAIDIEGRPVEYVNHIAPVDEPGTYYSELHPCPADCSNGSPANWTVYNSVDRLALCGNPMLLDFALYSPISGDVMVKLSACTAAGNANTKLNALFEPEEVVAPALLRRSENAVTTPCIVRDATKTTAEVDVFWAGAATRKVEEVFSNLQHLQRYFEEEATCDWKFRFVYFNGTVAGVYIGALVDRRSLASIVKPLLEYATAEGAPETMVMQQCGGGRNVNHVFGVIVDATGNLDTVQAAVRTWTQAKCVDNVSMTGRRESISLWESTEDSKPLNYTSRHTHHARHARHAQHLHPRAECRTVTIYAGDTCAKLATRCGITAAQFTTYNPSTGFCSSLMPEGRVCCSSGTMPDIKPKPDGLACFVYAVQSGDSCSSIAARNGLTVKELETFNDGTTWGWNGCGNLMSGINICLSNGTSPKPAEVSNAICGPTKPHTLPIIGNRKWEEQNPCPLNVCCNIWGQCGVTKDFCTVSRGPANNPGTAPPGTNSCISNCGTEIITGTAPAAYGRIGYYESWNFNRPCLHLRSANANTDNSYTIIHWAFAEISTVDWSVKITGDHNQWDGFKRLSGVKKVISFGGWGYSTEPGTYNILRQAMGPQNRNAFVTKLSQFLNEQDLDGVDIDWEYPGAMDIPDVPEPGTPSDGPNYLKFLTAMKAALPAGKTLSIAAPASYWYLKSFPIYEMSKVLDYIVYMTYDLHGQWDAGSQWSAEGCPTGNCLRSHVNITEVTNALVMITKAGVPSNKIFVGESSYGRSFKMAKAGCTGPDCLFLGDRNTSLAAPGICTGQAGYIANGELDRIGRSRSGVLKFHDGPSNTDIMVYNQTEWVAYMSPTTKETRRKFWQGKNFGGTIDWAVDLQDFTDDASGPDDLDEEDDETLDTEPNEACTADYTSLDNVEKDKGQLPGHCLNLYILQALKSTLQKTLDSYDELMEGGYDGKFTSYATAVAKSGQAQVINFMYEHGNEYFTCEVAEEVECCGFCKWSNIGGEDTWCRYCEDTCSDSEWSGCKKQWGNVNCKIPSSTYRLISEPCPPDYSRRGSPRPGSYDFGSGKGAVHWSLADDKRDLFFANLLNETGINETYITWEDKRYGGCIDSMKLACQNENKDYNFPKVNGYDAEDVTDPKDLVQEARGKLINMLPDLTTAVDEIKKGIFEGSQPDLVDAVSLPIAMVEEAVSSMQTIDDTVDEWNEAKRKAILMAFLTALFMFVPILGGVVGSFANLVGIGRMLALIGAVGNTALAIHDIVEDPENAPLAIFGLILEPLALLDVVKVAKAAKAARGMPADQVKALGGKTSNRLHSIDNIKGLCRPKTKRNVIPAPAWPVSNPMSEELDGQVLALW